MVRCSHSWDFKDFDGTLQFAPCVEEAMTSVRYRYVKPLHPLMEGVQEDAVCPDHAAMLCRDRDVVVLEERSLAANFAKGV